MSMTFKALKVNLVKIPEGYSEFSFKLQETTIVNFLLEKVWTLRWENLEIT